MLLALLGCGPKLPPPPPPSALSLELGVEGNLSDRLSDVPANLAIYYAGEHKGSMETCGCPKHPRGSLSRLSGYIEAENRHNPTPSVLVHGGYFLDASGVDDARPDLTLANAWMSRGLAAAGFDAINVGVLDLPVLADLDPASALPLVSANVVGPGIVPWKVVEREGTKIGITGMTRQDPSRTVKGYTVAAPDSVGDTLDALAAAADVVVLLAFQAPEAAHALAEKHAGIDIVIDTNRHTDATSPFVVGHALWVASTWQTMRLGELRLSLDQGTVKGALDRKIDLDDIIPDDRTLRGLQLDARAEIDAAQKAMFAP